MNRIRRACVTLRVVLALAMSGVLHPAAHAEQDASPPSDEAPVDFFGVPIAISGCTLVVARGGSAQIFARTGESWIDQQTLTASDATAIDGFGAAVAISGNTIVVGASGKDNRRGAVYVFVERGGIWTEAQKLTASDRTANDLFGNSVAFDGATLVVGAMGDDGNRGAAHIFAFRDGTWVQQQKLTASDRSVPAFPFDTFGESVAVAGDTIVVGAPRNGMGAATPPGSAYIFGRSGGAWTERQKLTASDDGSTNRFGHRLALSGETLAVAAPGDDRDRGAVYVFVRNDAGVWIGQPKVTASDGLTGDTFGSAVALGDGTLLVGAAGDDVGANNDQGAAYAFALKNGVWTEEQKLTAGEGAAGDGSGFSVTLRADELLVGAHLASVAGRRFQGLIHVVSPAPEGSELEAVEPDP